MEVMLSHGSSHYLVILMGSDEGVTLVLTLLALCTLSIARDCKPEYNILEAVSAPMSPPEDGSNSRSRNSIFWFQISGDG
jgi:hypothetical protein